MLSQVSPFEQGDNMVDSEGILIRNKNINTDTCCQVYSRIQGGFFAGSVESCKIYCDMYKIELERFIRTKNFAGKDQHVLFNLLLQNKHSNFIKLLFPDFQSWKPNHWASFMINMSRVPLITTLIQGGLGNQMFQVAVATAIALEIGGKAVFKNEKPPGITERPTYWNSVFRKCSSYLTLDEDFIDLHEHHNHCFTPVLEQTKYLNANSNSNGVKNIRLNGYFQSSKYFNLFKNEIKTLFSTSKQVEEWCQMVLQDTTIIPNSDCKKIAIHVRRTDYVKLGWNLSLDYYLKSVEKIKSNYKDNPLRFIVFSDDMEWCKENFNSVENIHFFEEGSDIQQMYLIGKCDGMICSNSSFSWWSTYLSNTHEVVTVPERWFKNANYNPDIYEPEWIKIEN
jgi:hypothetical protein